MNKKISITLAFSVIIILVLIVAGISFYLWREIKTENGSLINLPIKSKMVACTEEAKLCPDGSAVGRTAPNCEFAPCPEIVGIANKIIITSQKQNDEISNPVLISGKASGSWFFEGSFPIEIYDENNKLLITTSALFVPELETDTWMTEDFVDFKSVVNFNEPSADSGYILFKKDNPSDMRELDEEFKLPVKFSQDTVATTSISDWKTYTNTEYGFEFKHPHEIKVQKENYGLKIIFDKDALGYDREINIYDNEKLSDLTNWFDSTFSKEANKDCKKGKPHIEVDGADTLLINVDSMEQACLNGGYYTISPDSKFIINWSFGYGADGNANKIPSTLKFTN